MLAFVYIFDRAGRPLGSRGKTYWIDREILMPLLLLQRTNEINLLESESYFLCQ